MDDATARSRAEELAGVDYPGRDALAAECDLVMKGGITSGVVYPLAVCELGRRYRFRAIGGSSAGAIAAAFAAAAEHGRDAGGFGRLATLPAEVGTTLPDLFGPGPSTRTAHAAVMAAVAPGLSPVQKGVEVARTLVRSQRARFWRVLASGTAVAALLAFGIVGVPDDAVDGVRFAVLVVLAAGAAAVLAAVLAIAAEARATWAGLASQGFGVCIGSGGPGDLTDWLAARLDDVAGTDRPLTFGDLAAVGVDLKVMTTDLTHGRPLSFPFAAGTSYLFDPDELRTYFPPAIVERLVAGRAPSVDDGGRRLWSIPGPDDLPVVFAARISLSFPGLISAVPLWSLDGGDPVRCWFSDGGITSNFPIHLFDTLWPRRPTFALDLRPYPKGEDGAADVEYRGPDPRPPRARTIDSPGSFVAAILDTMQYWADDAQAVLPGFRDRVVEVRLGPDEGGMNLRMPPPVVDRVAEKGRQAAEAIVAGFDLDRHRWTRYLTAMSRLQVASGSLGPQLGAYEALLDRAPDAAAFRRDEAWVAQALVRTRDLVRFGSSSEPDFAEGAPAPEPALRLTPHY